MTDDSVTPPASPAYPSAPAPYSVAPVQTVVPGRTLGIVGFVLSFFFLANIVGLILSIVGLVQSRRVGQKNGFAVAGIIIAGVGILISAAIVASAVGALVDAAATCARLGNGVHEVGNSVYTCTPTSFNVSTRG